MPPQKFRLTNQKEINNKVLMLPTRPSTQIHIPCLTFTNIALDYSSYIVALRTPNQPPTKIPKTYILMTSPNFICSCVTIYPHKTFIIEIAITTQERHSMPRLSSLKDISFSNANVHIIVTLPCTSCCLLHVQTFSLSHGKNFF